MAREQKTLLAMTLLALVVLLAACGQGDIRIGWLESSTPGHIGASYARFTGTETRTVPVQAGQTLYLEYDAEVDQGNLCLEVDDPYGQTVWSISLCKDCGEIKALPVNNPGCYTISVRGETTEGNFDLKWEPK